MTARRLAAVGLIVGLAGCLAPPPPGPAEQPPHSDRCPTAATTLPARPNIVFILSDDQTYSQLPFMPITRSLLADQGMTFTHYYVTLGLCCPSRSTTLRGQYPHNTGVLTNFAPDGGFQRFHEQGEESSTIATWLQAGGYVTGLYGKYLNEYPDSNFPTYIPPGWSRWGALLSEAYYDYDQNVDGHVEHHAEAPDDYSTDVVHRQAVDFICQAALQPKPFFAWIAPFGPHRPSTPAPRDFDRFIGVLYPRAPSFNVSFDTTMPPLPPDTIALVDTLWQRQLESLQSVDDLVEGVVTALRTAGVLDQTYIFFASDNGYHMGEHRLPPGKATFYEEDVHVPLIVRGPGVPANSTVSQFVLNNDLAPTWAELGGVTPASFVDGRSIVPLLMGNTSVPWRKAFALDRFQFGSVGASLHNDTLVYRELPPAFRELYNLRADPYEIYNQLPGGIDSTVLADLSRWLTLVKVCAAATCRVAEDSAF